jgi:hypothetical protein
MAQGMRLPIEVTKRGGARLVEGLQCLWQYLVTAFSPNQSENPYQDLPLMDEVLFSPKNKALAGLIKSKTTEIFASFEEEGLVKLAARNPISLDYSRAGKVDLVIRYVDLETDEELEIRRELKPSQ